MSDRDYISDLAHDELQAEIDFEEAEQTSARLTGHGTYHPDRLHALLDERERRSTTTN